MPTEHVEVAGIRAEGTRDRNGVPSAQILLSSSPRNCIKPEQWNLSQAGEREGFQAEGRRARSSVKTRSVLAEPGTSTTLRTGVQVPSWFGVPSVGVFQKCGQRSLGKCDQKASWGHNAEVLSEQWWCCPCAFTHCCPAPAPGSISGRDPSPVQGKGGVSWRNFLGASSV